MGPAVVLASHALIRRGETYLVTLRSESNDFMPLKWDLPGGTVEGDETLEQALVREVKEETSLLVTAGRLIHAYTNVAGYPQRLTVQCVFLCGDPGDEVTLAADEHVDYRWLPRREMETLDAIPFLADLLRVRPFD